MSFSWNQDDSAEAIYVEVWNWTPSRGMFANFCSRSNYFDESFSELIKCISFWPIKTIVDFRTSAPCGRQVSLISAAWPCTDDKSSDGHGSFTVPPACCRAGKKETSSFEFSVPAPSKKKCDYLPKVHDPSGPLADQNPPQPDPIDVIYFFLKKE